MDFAGPVGITIDPKSEGTHRASEGETLVPTPPIALPAFSVRVSCPAVRP